MRKGVDLQRRTAVYGIMIGWGFTAAASLMLWFASKDAKALSLDMATPIAAIRLIGLATVIGQLLAAVIYKLRRRTMDEIKRQSKSAYFLFITMALCPTIIILWLYSGVSLFMSVAQQPVRGLNLYAEPEIIIHVESFWAIMLHVSAYIFVLTVIWFIVSWFLYKLIIKNWIKAQSIDPITLLVFVIVGIAVVIAMEVLLKLSYGFIIYENYVAYEPRQVEVYTSLLLTVWIICISLSKHIGKNE